MDARKVTDVTRSSCSLINQESQMKLWIGMDGHVYDHFIGVDMHTELGTTVPEAKEVEGKLGFLLMNGEYTPVEYHFGKWIPAKKETVQKVYEEQTHVWICNGANMPDGYHETFLHMLNKAV